MAVETAADRAAFLTPDEFGEQVTWTVGVVTSTLAVLSSTGTLRLERDDGLAVLSSNASFLCRSADVPAGAGKGNSVTFRSAAHAVESIEPDGTGMTVVRLKRS